MLYRNTQIKIITIITRSVMRRIIAGLFCPMHTDNKIQSEQFKRTLDHNADDKHAEVPFRSSYRNWGVPDYIVRLSFLSSSPFCCSWTNA